jgi:pimeloyl-ACP methyl ester carboxylesterase
VVLHGLLGQSRNFVTWAKELKDAHFGDDCGRRFFLADLRNHGESPHDPSMGYEHQAADIVRLLDRIGCASAVLVGHSMGGKVAMATSLLAPDRVAALCVIDIAPVEYSIVDGTDWHLAHSMVRALAELPMESLTSRRDADATLSRVVVDPMLRAFALMNLDVDDRGLPRQQPEPSLPSSCSEAAATTTMSPEANDATTLTGLAWRINIGALADQLDVIAGVDIGSAAVAPFTRPTLFVKGTASRYFQEDAHLLRARGFFPRAALSVIDGAGHWVHVSKPKELQAEVAALVRAAV